tara:strand:+ start:133568 stop:135493 length:1926 start_codon:yes stop_codon:yes gene_type:complete
LKNRIVFLFILIFFAFSALVVRGAYLQLFPNKKLSQLMERQFQTRINLHSRRGSILDRNGRELGVSVTSYSIYADPSIIGKKSFVAKKVSRYLQSSYSSVHRKLKKKNTRFVWLERQASQEVKDKIAAMNLLGIGIVEEPKRIYPNKHLASHLLGFIGRNGEGLEGLEFSLEEKLRGAKKEYFVKRDARGRPLLMDLQSLEAPKDGKDVRLSLDIELQYMLEKKLNEALAKYSAEMGVGVILDAKTSEILAMGTTPSFDANAPFNVPPGYRRNRTIVDAFEPGSTLKTFAIAAALQLGKVEPNTSINCEGGHFKIGKRVIREADASHSFDELTVSEVLAKSSNVGSSKVAIEVGAKSYRDFLVQMGFGRKPSVEFPGVTSGILHDLPWGRHQLANISFGHGLTASPLQIAAAYAVIANKGWYTEPSLIKGASRERRRVLDEDVAHKMNLMLMGVTARTGTGYSARIPGFPVAGKTGTAQKVDFKNGGYLKGEYIASFAGFVPANDPRYVIYIAIDNPKNKYYGSEVAAPVFAEVAQYAMRKSGIQPILISNKNLLDSKWDEMQFSAPKKVSSPLLEEAQRELAQNRLPQLKGMNLRDALKVSSEIKANVIVKGRGRVEYTVPGAGVTLGPEFKELKLILSE